MEARRSKPKRWTQDWLNNTVPGQFAKWIIVAVGVAGLSAAGNYFSVIPSNAEKGEQAFRMTRDLSHRLDSTCTRIDAIGTRQNIIENRMADQYKEVKEDIGDIKETQKEILNVLLHK